MPIGEYNHPLFGLVKFQTEHDYWKYGDPITFIDGFDSRDVEDVYVPQLKNVENAHGGTIKFHKRGKKQLLAAFNDIERLGLLKHIKQTAGAYYQRLKKPISGKLSKEPSNHSFGIAIDLNSDDDCNGCTTAPLAPVFQNYGFKWGKSFNDPMHYEVMKFIDNPVSTVNEVDVAINGSGINFGGKNIFGNLFLELDKVADIPGLSIAKDAGKKVQVAGSKGSKVFTKLQFGDLQFIPLPQALGLAGLKMKFDNDDKTAVAEEIT